MPEFSNLTRETVAKVLLFDPKKAFKVWLYTGENHEEVGSPKASWDGFALKIRCPNVAANRDAFALRVGGKVIWCERFARPYPEHDFLIERDFSVSGSCVARWPG